MIIYNNNVKESEVYLYTLKCENENPFYVGKTNNPSLRYRSHISKYQKHSNKLKNEKISEIKNNNKELLMVVFWGGNNSEWKQAERYWISKYKYDWQIPILNIHSGGDGVEFTNEIKEKISKSRLGIKLKESTILKMKGRIPWNKGKLIHNVKNVKQYSIKGELLNTFNSIKEAGEILNINRGNISLVVNGKRKSIGGYVFKYSDN